MYLTSGEVTTLVICAVLTLLASFLTVVCSVLSGVALAYYARPNFRYGATLALLVFPFAIGGCVWAYSVTQVASATELRKELVSAGTITRCLVLFLLCMARIVPLGTFFCATTLQRFTSEIRPYCRTHQLELSFFLLCALNRIPKSILVFLGLFGGASMASEASLATFLYRANPGTEPETVNILLARLFREIYANSGPESLTKVATLGFAVSVLLIIASMVGTYAGRGVLFVVCVLLRKTMSATGVFPIVYSIMACVAIAFVLAPGILAPIGLFIPNRLDALTIPNVVERSFSYKGIVLLGVSVAATITAGGIALAVRLRYSRTDWLRLLERSPAAACLLMIPAFVPILSVVALLGKLSGGRMTGGIGYVALFGSHVALHYSVFQFICIALIATIPARHVEWQMVSRLRYYFSLVTDGFRRHASVVVALVGLGTVLVVTDGSVSRWFASLVNAPEESLYGAVFGRLASIPEAMAIAWSVAVVAAVVSATLAAAFVADLVRRTT